MKKIIIAITACAATVCAAAQEMPDTLLSVENPTMVTITESPAGFAVTTATETVDGPEVSVYSQDYDSPFRVEARRWRGVAALPLGKSSNHQWAIIMSGPGLGWINSCGQPDEMGAEMGKSLEISWLYALGVTYKAPWKTSSLTFGIGFDWRNYRISTSASCFEPTDKGTVSIGKYADDVTPKGSRLKVFSISFPVLWNQSLPFRWFGQPFQLSAGAVLNLNTHASLNTKWLTDDGLKAERTSNNIGQRRVTVDLLALVRLGGNLNAYVRYSPNTVLKGANQPQFKPLSAGLILFY